MKTVQEQMQLIRRGTELLIDEEELTTKLERSIAEQRPLIIKLGVDPTAPDIHLGHTVPLRKLRHFQDLGHEVVFLIGDFTGRIGDPSGRDKTRPPLTEEDILSNAKTYITQVSKILDPSKLRVEYNSSWLNQLNFGELIKMAANTTMAKMLEHNTFRQRLDASDSIRMHEMLYPFMQGYDSVALRADVELGGSDQTFNLTFGRDLQRFYGQEAQICITMPILTGTDGVKKMSKSLGNYIGIDEPPAIMFDKIMRMTDDNIINYMTLLTDISDEEINVVHTNLTNSPTTEYIIDQKKRIAGEIIKTYHGEEAAEIQVNSYGKVKTKGLPEISVTSYENAEGLVSIAKLLTEALGFSSKSEARRAIENGAVSVNGEKIVDILANIHLNKSDVLKVSKVKSYKII
ncbi:MAG: tyrosine--tRNA ligase [Saprospiraceae bacterium]|nr:tyrosine--tRNA ligase [Saprospiraceae bacterium]